MSVTLYAGDVDDLTGAVFASWFVFSPNGPTAFAVGFAETAHIPWSLFYRRMHFAGAKTYLGAAIDTEISAASGNFFHAFFNHMIALNNYLALNSRDAPEFLGEVPSFIRTNGNPEVDAAMRWLIADTADRLGTDWGQELYLRETYGAALADPAVTELRQAHRGYRKQKEPPLRGAICALVGHSDRQGKCRAVHLSICSSLGRCGSAAKRSGQFDPLFFGEQPDVLLRAGSLLRQLPHAAAAARG